MPLFTILIMLDGLLVFEFGVTLFLQDEIIIVTRINVTKQVISFLLKFYITNYFIHLKIKYPKYRTKLNIYNQNWNSQFMTYGINGSTINKIFYPRMSMSTNN